MKKITLKITTFLMLTMFALQVHAQPCPELWLDPGVYKLATCGLTPELYMTISTTTGDLEWAAELPGDDPTQLWTVTDHRTPASSGYVEIWATIPGVGDFAMAVDQSTYTGGTPADDEIRLTVVPGQPIGDAADPNYGFDQFQRRKATGWSGTGNNALFAKPPGQGNLRYSVPPAAAGDQVLFQNPGTISPIRFILNSLLSAADFDTSSIFVSNPVNDELTIKGLTQNVKDVNIYSLLGKQVMSIKVDGASTLNMDVSTLASGLYIVKMVGDNGSYSKKIIKE
ncbi:T9SS type A sorting domain-containing protein [Algibacter luteus]|uniref:Por secretion system C-terminal sorting domain-containing protein n=1 Tax=Algibacter luteus TaxID=1178825 RepID=A0A1M6A4Z9_9FLAO|nr:T9SS type A sorting domain-containing protein [Algibacter luteus]SHI31253.1 Por secretion system C-terminal sorting domain-containing protein [Algibacter luteus]